MRLNGRAGSRGEKKGRGFYAPPLSTLIETRPIITRYPLLPEPMN